MRKLTLVLALASCSSNTGAPGPDPKYALTNYLAEVGRLPEKQKMNRYLDDENGCKHDVKWSEPCALCGPSEARRIVQAQANDSGLWFEATTAPEAYLQQELRRLHAAVERETGQETGPRRFTAAQLEDLQATAGSEPEERLP